MVNFMWQLDWAMGYPDIWSNTNLSVSGRVLLGKINIWIRRLSKDYSPFCGQDLANQLKTWIKQRKLRGNPCAWQLGMEHRYFPVFGLKLKNWLFLILKPASFQTGTSIFIQLTWFSGFWAQISGVPGLPTAALETSPPLESHEPIPYKYRSALSL